MVKKRYEEAKKIYAKIGIDTDEALKRLNEISISIHCWQGDDVAGFEVGGVLSGGIAVTGNYFGKATTPEELMADLDFALSMIPGKHRINLHASYGIFESGPVDRDKIEPKHFAKWVQFAKERGLGLDFNPTFFSHPLSVNGTLSNVDEEVRQFWVEHGKRSVEIAEYFATELGEPCLLNIWIPDGFKDTPGDRLSPRMRLKLSLDEIIHMPYNKELVRVAVESKVFGIGMESYTVGSHEFYLNYAAKNDVLCLLDNGHFHPTEMMADKLSSMLLFHPLVALHVTRAVRWDSDHVVTYDDEIRGIANEIIQHGSERFLIGLDFFDGSVNRIAAWVLGVRNMQKALLAALLTPHEKFVKLQEVQDFTQLLVLQEHVKLLPVGDVWAYFCETSEVLSDFDWLSKVKVYESEVLSKRKG